jgi:hypothetical protein
MTTYSQEYSDRSAASARARNTCFEAGDIEMLIGRPGPTKQLREDNPGLRVVQWLCEVGSARVCTDHVRALPDEREPMAYPAAGARFVEWMREMGLAGEYREPDFRLYIDWWQRDERVGRLSPNLLLAHVVNQPGVERYRRRVRDLPLPNNRVFFYTIFDEVEPLEITSGDDAGDGQMQLQLAA